MAAAALILQSPAVSHSGFEGIRRAQRRHSVLIIATSLNLLQVIWGGRRARPSTIVGSALHVRVLWDSSLSFVHHSNPSAWTDAVRTSLLHPALETLRRGCGVAIHPVKQGGTIAVLVEVAGALFAIHWLADALSCFPTARIPNPGRSVAICGKRFMAAALQFVCSLLRCSARAN